MGKVLAIANQKGGVGKTTTSVNLAASLKFTRKDVLLIDLDPQGNATMGSGVDKSSLETSIYDVLMQHAGFDEVVQRPEASGYDLLPANGDLVAAEVELISEDNRECRLRQIIDQVRHRYDYVVIDCPPSLNMLTINAIRDSLNPDLKIEGIVRTMYDPRNKLTTEVNGQLISFFGDAVYRTVVPRNIRLAEAPSYGKPVLNYDKQSRGAIAYLALAGEVLRRNDEAIARAAV